MKFNVIPANDLVFDTLKNQDGNVEFQNVLSSNHACFLHFYNGHKMFKHNVTNAQLIPQEGIIMSSGKPENFCWNDSDEMTTKGNMLGDANLTNMTKQEMFDAVGFPITFLWYHIFGLLSSY